MALDGFVIAFSEGDKKRTLTKSLAPSGEADQQYGRRYLEASHAGKTKTVTHKFLGRATKNCDTRFSHLWRRSTFGALTQPTETVTTTFWVWKAPCTPVETPTDVTGDDETPHLLHTN